jgi:hypothetical protein
VGRDDMRAPERTKIGHRTVVLWAAVALVSVLAVALPGATDSGALPCRRTRAAGA